MQLTTIGINSHQYEIRGFFNQWCRPRVGILSLDPAEGPLAPDDKGLRNVIRRILRSAVYSAVALSTPAIGQLDAFQDFVDFADFNPCSHDRMK